MKLLESDDARPRQACYDPAQPRVKCAYSARGEFKIRRRHAILPQDFCPKATFPFRAAGKTRNGGHWVDEKGEGALSEQCDFLGVPRHSFSTTSCSFAFLVKSLKCLPLLFSIRTVATESSVEAVTFASRELQSDTQRVLFSAPSWPPILARLCRGMSRLHSQLGCGYH
jgi:hypothetical protein